MIIKLSFTYEESKMGYRPVNSILFQLDVSSFKT